MKSSPRTSYLPEVVRRLGRLEVRARHIVEGMMSGLHRSPYFGQSVEFLQHRQYTHGDDLRHVDWKVWAKQDRLYVKQYEEDTNLRCTLLVDTSASMAYGQGPMTKYDYATTAAAALALLMLRQQDSVGCVTFAENINHIVPLRTGRGQLNSILSALESADNSQKTNVADVLATAAEKFPRRGMMILVSDLLVEPATLLRGIRQLRQRGHDVLVFHILDDDELDFPFTGPARFEGLESSEHVQCNPKALRDGYLAAMEEFQSTIRRGCAAEGVEYALVRTSDPFDAALLTLLSRRMGSRRAGA